MQTAAAEAVAESQQQAELQIREREAKLREMELEFLRQQHKSRHLERLAKMKLGTTVEKHAYSSAKSVERLVILSEDETMVSSRHCCARSESFVQNV